MYQLSLVGIGPLNRKPTKFDVISGGCRSDAESIEVIHHCKGIGPIP